MPCAALQTQFQGAFWSSYGALASQEWLLIHCLGLSSYPALHPHVSFVYFSESRTFISALSGGTSLSFSGVRRGTAPLKPVFFTLFVVINGC